MKSLLKDTTFADVTFEVEGQEVKAHRNILSARSPSFKAMFTRYHCHTHVFPGPRLQDSLSTIRLWSTSCSGLSECAPEAVIRLDCRESIFQAVLKYIYYEEVSISGNAATLFFFFVEFSD